MNFAEGLQRRGLQYRRNSNDDAWFHICCLFCPERGNEPDTKFRLGINIKTGGARCFKCGWTSRNGPYWVLRRLELDPTLYSAAVPERSKAPLVARLPEDFRVIDRAFDALDREARDYVLRRGISPKQILRHDIGVSFTGRYAYRIVFPIYAIPWADPNRTPLGASSAEKPRLVGLTARDFTGHREPRYLNSPGDKYFYNWSPSAETMVLAEGPIKALRIERVFGCGAALQGHSLTERQLEPVERSQCKRIVIWPDPNLVGRRGAVKVAEQLLEQWRGQVSMIWPAPTPPDDAPFSEIEQRLKHPVDFDFNCKQKITLALGV